MYIYAIMKTMCPPGYHHNGFVATHPLGHIMYGYMLLVPKSVQQAKAVIHVIIVNCYNCYIGYI